MFVLEDLLVLLTRILRARLLVGDCLRDPLEHLRLFVQFHWVLSGWRVARLLIGVVRIF